MWRHVLGFALSLLVTPAAWASGAGQFGFVGMNGQPMPLALFEGRALLVANVGSVCDLGPEYYRLQALWERFRDRGLVVIGVPSADFETASRDRRYCALDPSLDFPMTRLEAVTGERAHPFYRWVAERYGLRGVPEGEFAKILIDPEGALMEVWQPATQADSPELARAIEAVLPR
jgi:glutathione peroxidase